VDPDQIKQVFLNILLNAIDAQGEGGVIHLEGVQQDGFVGFAVSDEGPGISPDDLPYIYDPFFTLKEKGTGLGLSVVHRILDQHGGRIWKLSICVISSRLYLEFFEIIFIIKGILETYIEGFKRKTYHWHCSGHSFIFYGGFDFLY